MRRRAALAGLAATAILLTGCGGSDSSSAAKKDAGTPQDGGEVTVLEDVGHAGSWPTGLDPATNTTGGANLAPM